MAGKRLNMVGASKKRSVGSKKKKKSGSNSTKQHRPGQPFKKTWKKSGKWA
tara:strand:+ start:1255 stop:1407 length:153 start_codon:yes stop_codon:yes gene_type:complete